MSIEYRVCISPKDYAFCRLILDAWGHRNPELAYPTVMAWRTGWLVGILGTSLTADGALVAGPLVVAPGIKAKGVLVLRLLQHYEALISGLGKISYVFYVDMRKAWYKTVLRAGLEPVFENSTTHMAWFCCHVGTFSGKESLWAARQQLQG